MACDNKKENPEARKGYKTPEQKLSSDIMTPEVLWSFGRISNPAISPDGSKAVYGVTYFNKEEDRSYTDLYVMNLVDGKITQITDTDYNESDANWTPDGKRISYLAKGQLWEMNPDGSGAKQITQIEGGINGYLYAPDGSKIAYYKDIKMEPTVQDMHPDLPKAKARIINDQFYRHWNDWVEGYTHIFIADYTPAQPITSGQDIMKDEKWESPVRPWGGTEQLAWTRDGQKLIYTCRKKYGIDYAFSTNTDLYAYSTADGTTVNLTEGMMGYDKNPVLSPDGKKWLGKVWKGTAMKLIKTGFSSWIWKPERKRTLRKILTKVWAIWLGIRIIIPFGLSRTTTQQTKFIPSIQRAGKSKNTRTAFTIILP